MSRDELGPAMTWADELQQPTPRHRPTDPACRFHQPPRTKLGRWWHDRQRGFGCPWCVPSWRGLAL